MTEKLKFYRKLIDALVDICRNGQGQIGARRVLNGMWNANATTEIAPDQLAINNLLANLSQADRQVLASMVASEFQAGIFETLKTLETFGVVPLDGGYEGSPYEDFVGRLNDWQWPER